jgi:hypothetical protein
MPQHGCERQSVMDMYWYRLESLAIYMTSTLSRNGSTFTSMFMQRRFTSHLAKDLLVPDGLPILTRPVSLRHMRP